MWNPFHHSPSPSSASEIRLKPAVLSFVREIPHLQAVLPAVFLQVIFEIIVFHHRLVVIVILVEFLKLPAEIRRKLLRNGFPYFPRQAFPAYGL